MKKETRTVVYDTKLQIEAYRFQGIVQPFPNHFHEQYVLGFVENGQRTLSCKNKEYRIARGDIVLFQPEDNHACVQSDGGTFDYRGFHISKHIMLDLTQEITGKRELPGFSQPVICDEEILWYLRQLHEQIMGDGSDIEKEETLLLLMSALMQTYGQPPECCGSADTQAIEQACAWMRRHLAERISLDQICENAGCSKSTLLRAFTKAKGITPYRYFETIRMNKAKALLEQGVPPIEVAMQTGFSDQSHFTNCFSSVIGLSPGTYREIFSERNKTSEQQRKE